LIVSNELTLEQVYAALTPAEQQLGRRVSPTAYRGGIPPPAGGGNPFLAKVLAGAIIRLTATTMASSPLDNLVRIASSRPSRRRRRSSMAWFVPV